jgi:hypothetical protein
VVDDGGRVLSRTAQSVYDDALCEQVGAVLARVVDAIQLQHPDWESLSAQYADGKLMVRNLGQLPQSGPCLLVLVADAALNGSFAAVAMRVAANKLRQAGGRSPVPSSPPPTFSPSPRPLPMASLSSGLRPPPFPAPPVLTPPPSSPSSPGSAPRDPAAAAFLARCTRELARQVGPMARVFVEEAVRRVASGGRPFVMGMRQALLDDLAAQVEDPAGREAFVSGVKNPAGP